MRTDSQYRDDMEFEKKVSVWLRRNWEPLKSGKAVLVDDPQMQYAGADLSCCNGLLVDLKIKNRDTINQMTKWPSVEIRTP